MMCATRVSHKSTRTMMIWWHTLIVHRLRCIHVDHITQVWRVSSIVSSALWISCLVLNTWICHLVIAWMVWMVGRHYTSMSLMICGILLWHTSLIIIWRRIVLIWIIVRNICLSRLRTDAVTKTTNSWALLVIVMIITVHISSVAHRPSTMVVVSVVCVRAQEIVVCAIISIWMVTLVVHLDICLTKLIKYWPRSLGINCRNLSHNLAIVGAIVVFPCALDLLIRANLRWTALVTVWSKIFALSSFIWRSISCVQKVSSRALLVVNYSIFS